MRSVRRTLVAFGLAMFLLPAQIACTTTPETTEPPGETPETPQNPQNPQNPGAPSGTILFQENFEDANLTARGWYDVSGILISTAEHTGTGSTGSAHFRFLQGATNATHRGGRHKFTPSSSLYIRYHVKYSANWVGSNRTHHPHEIFVMSTMDSDFNGPANAWMTLYVEHNYQNGGKPRLGMQDNRAINTTQGALPNNLVSVTEDRSTSGCNGGVEAGFHFSCFNSGSGWFNDKGIMGPVTFQPTAGAGYKNDWNLVEVYFQLNTVQNGIGQANGIMRYWFNGQLVIDRSDILFRTGSRASLQLSQFLLSPYIGDGSPVEQSVFIDNLVVATAR